MNAPANVRVLFVDDEEDILDAYGDLLRMLFGWQVTCAASGTEALSILRQKEFDVIVSDYRMPRMSGVQFLRKARVVAPRTPFVILTAYDDPELEAAALEAGAARFLGKAESPKSIAASILEVLGSPVGPKASKTKGPTNGKPKNSPRDPQVGDLPAGDQGGSPPFSPTSTHGSGMPGPLGMPFDGELLRPEFDLWGR